MVDVDLDIAMAIGTAVTSCAAGLLGYWFDRKAFNALVLALCTALACGLCVIGLRFGKWIGLCAAIALVAVLAYRLGSSFGKSKQHARAKRRGGIFVAVLWLWFSAGWAVGWLAGGVIGLATVLLPGIVLFWGGLKAISLFLLPVKDREQRRRSFRSLVTFSLGTNFPYYNLDGTDSSPRVEGNQFGQMFAGPGIILTDPAHAPVVWDGTKFTGVGEPGLSFAGRFDMIYEAVDLRPQLRTLRLEGITKDGIRIRVGASVVVCLNAGGHSPKLGGSFPVDKDLTYKAVWQQPIEGGVRRSWDQIVPVVVERLVRRILGEYQCDDLCDATGTARDAIANTLVRRLRAELRSCGIVVLRCWISNLEPVDTDVVKERVEAWRAEWQRRIMVTSGEAKADALQAVENAYAQTQAHLISAVEALVTGPHSVHPELLTKMAALRFIEALEEMAESAQAEQPLAADTAETLGYFHKVLS